MVGQDLLTLSKTAEQVSRSGFSETMGYHGRAQLFHCWGFAEQSKIPVSVLQGLKEAMKENRDEGSIIRYPVSPSLLPYSFKHCLK